MPPPVKVALLGCGVVGTEVARIITRDADELAQRVGAPVELIGVAVRDLNRHRDADLDPALLTTDAEMLVQQADIVVEVMGGMEPARTYILQALASGASVVSANKALLATDGPALYAAATEHHVDLYYEAAVAGAIPLLRPLRESLAGDQVRQVVGIVNGTTNFILDKMDSQGWDFDQALAEAQKLGYAEADPTADVEGLDAAAKAAILASVAFHSRVGAADVFVQGITRVSTDDIREAKAMDHVIKLIAICEQLPAEMDGQLAGVSVRVYPAMIPRSHPLAMVGDAYNAVFVRAEAAGELMFYGRGAGGVPTASAVMGDVMTVARNRVSGAHGPGESAYAGLPVVPMSQVPTQYYLNLRVADRPGVLAQIAGVFAYHQVSIATLQQRQVLSVVPAGDQPEIEASLVVVTHRATDAALAATVQALAAADSVMQVTSVLRVERML